MIKWYCLYNSFTHLNDNENQNIGHTHGILKSNVHNKINCSYLIIIKYEISDVLVKKKPTLCDHLQYCQVWSESDT